MAEKTCDSCRCNAVCDHDRFGFENCGNYIPSSCLLAEEKERERLIDLIMSAPKLPFYATDSEIVKLYPTILETAQYLLENGVILPPCKVGDIVYRPIGWDDYVEECKVSSLTMKADGSWKIRLTSGRYRGVFEITPDEIGKTVFLSREDAEKALEERKEK